MVIVIGSYFLFKCLRQNKSYHPLPPPFFLDYGSVKSQILVKQNQEIREEYSFNIFMHIQGLAYILSFDYLIGAVLWFSPHWIWICQVLHEYLEHISRSSSDCFQLSSNNLLQITCLKLCFSTRVPGGNWWTVGAAWGCRCHSFLCWFAKKINQPLAFDIVK